MRNYATQGYLLIMTTTVSLFETGTPPPIVLRHRLRIAREHAGLEQEDLADLIGVSRNTISNAEKGRVRPRRITLNAVALATGVPISWFLEGDGDDELVAKQPAGSGSPPGLPDTKAKVSDRRKRQPVGYPSLCLRAAAQLPTAV